MLEITAHVFIILFAVFLALMTVLTVLQSKWNESQMRLNQIAKERIDVLETELDRIHRMLLSHISETKP